MFDSHRKGFKKNYTDLFNSYRMSLKITPHHQNDMQNNIVTAISENINIKLSILERKITELSELFTQRARPTFDNVEIEICDHNIRQTTNEISNRISDINSEINRPIPTQDNEVATLLMNLQQCHKLRLSALVQRFRNLQATKRVASISSVRQNDTILSSAIDSINNNSDSDSSAQLQHNQELEQIQHDDIAQLVTMMNELNSLFRDVSLLIFEQGTVLDRIDTKIELAVQDVERGNEQLERANEYQSSNCFYVYISVLVGLIFICILIMLFRKR
ncbi:Syntaxin-16 [Tritrichomonas musculus]|uniref:Syntaxin-16 n=1 Tax=Tritrichomonas musculus TaxID=1915356 RepID=A0ABR2JM31_9EUKA